MVRIFVFLLVVLFLFIVYYIIKSLWKTNQILRSSQNKGKRKDSRFKDIEEADFKEIDTSSKKKNDKDAQE
jgi:hypothetical protein